MFNRVIKELDNEPEIRDIEDSLNKLFDILRTRGSVRHGMVALARVLQSELTRGDCPEDVPHASALELIMRSVAADIEGCRSTYVINKLENGVARLLSHYKSSACDTQQDV